MPPKKHTKGLVSALIADMNKMSVSTIKPKKKATTADKLATKVKPTAKVKPATKVKPTAKVKPTSKVKPTTPIKTKPLKAKYDRIGQTKETPPENDSLRKFYWSLLHQRPDSMMAMKWCLERGLIQNA